MAASGSAAPTAGGMGHALRCLLVSVVLFGGAWPITKAAMANATPLWFALGRVGFAALASGLVLALLGRLRLPRGPDRRVVLVLGVLQFGGFFVLTHLAVALVPAGRTAVLSNVVTYWLIPLSVLVLGERVSARRWGAAGLGLLGAAALVGPWAVDWRDAEMLLGHAMLVGAALVWSLAIVATRKWPPRRPMLDLLPWCFGLATLLLLPLALLREPTGGIAGPAWPLMLFVGLVAAPVGSWCVIEAGRLLPGAVAAVGFLLIPAFGVLASAIWLAEPVGWDVIIGGALIVASVLLAARG